MQNYITLDDLQTVEDSEKNPLSHDERKLCFHLASYSNRMMIEFRELGISINNNKAVKAFFLALMFNPKSIRSRNIPIEYKVDKSQIEKDKDGLESWKKHLDYEIAMMKICPHDVMHASSRDPEFYVIYMNAWRVAIDELEKQLNDSE